ncbi:MAG: DUF362 domain-containing protein [Caldilineaceae bacterium]|nr:DUF362 domain-containing protein [Caldilineaceae bacterium]
MNEVAVVRLAEAEYPSQAPYHPSEAYPEYPFASALSSAPNLVYAGVRQLFYDLGFDRERYGTVDWNPLGHLIKPGMSVVLKPNFVLSSHKARKDLFSIITHPSVLRAAGDYAWIALQGQGKLVIADSPQYDCDWEELLAATGVDKVIGFYQTQSGPSAALYDLRPYWSRWKHFSSMLEPLSGDPEGDLVINLGKKSALYHKSHVDKLYGAVYHRQETIAHHSGEIQEYQVARTILNADVVISVPKLKVHKKVGVTLNVKGLVGINTNKNYLVHYSVTPPSQGGDQYPDGLLTPTEKALITTERWMYDHLLAPRNPFLERIHRSIYWLHNHTTRRFGLKVEEQKRLFDAGNWYGNDSAWRMSVDLLRIFLFADRKGQLQSTPQRRVFSIIDGVLGGDGNGPLTPDPVRSAVLIAGENLLATDIVATRLMGFDPLKVKMHQVLLSDPYFHFGIDGLEEIHVVCADMACANCLSDTVNPILNFRPHPGWIGHLEVKPEQIITFTRNRSEKS